MAGSERLERLDSYLLSKNTKCLVSGNDVISQAHHVRDRRPHNLVAVVVVVVVVAVVVVVVVEVVVGVVVVVVGVVAVVVVEVVVVVVVVNCFICMTARFYSIAKAYL